MITGQPPSVGRRAVSIPIVGAYRRYVPFWGEGRLKKENAMSKRYSNTIKAKTLILLREKSMEEVSKQQGIPVSTIRTWNKNYDDIIHAYYRELHHEGNHRILLAQKMMADKIHTLLEAITDERISKAPLNQLTSAIGVLTDRYLKVHDVKELQKDTDSVHRIEYYDANTGEVSEAPPWAERDSESGKPILGGILRAAIRQNGTGKTADYRTRMAWDEDMVAVPDVHDSQSSVARPEDDDDGRDWYHD